MKQFLSRYWLIVALAMGAVVLGWQYWQRQKQTWPELVKIAPPAQTAVQQSKATVFFRQDLSPWKGKFRVEATPLLAVSLNVTGKQLELSWPAPAAASRYFFRLYLNGKLFFSWWYQLTPAAPTPAAVTITPSPIATSSAGRGDPAAVRKMLKDIGDNYPLIRYMPFSNQDFAINYSGPRQLAVKIKGADKEKIKDEVFRWLQNHGYQPASHKIIWK